ncbi:hypothetical protein EOD39_10500 [Acipenser ruthenus]|uniref:Uncharacterized protein n=1 Tax=Acipenser ruthenus TaxID=7906 RepID=A0A444TXQ1_ACIRT|nr:hypothetical protein EOD39_10500 [Acipenser ruthenus]
MTALGERAQPVQPDHSPRRTKYEPLSTQDIPDGKAETITQTLLKILQDYGLDCQKLWKRWGKCNEGPKSRSVHEDKSTIPNHCISHQPALTSADAANAIGYVKVT